jgi:hypothetical protein
MYNRDINDFKVGDGVHLDSFFIREKGLEKYISTSDYWKVERVNVIGGELLVSIEFINNDNRKGIGARYWVTPIDVIGHTRIYSPSYATDDLVYRVKNQGIFEIKDFDVCRKFIKEMKDSIGSTSFETITKEMVKTYVDKNHDYGNSFDKSMDEFGITAAVVRMSDKMERLKTLSKTDAKVADEKIEDTLLDLANYAVMTVMYLRGKKDGEAEQK